MKILLSLPENPFDYTNGAARSMRTIAELMAAAGHEVRCVATTATEYPANAIDPMEAFVSVRGVVYTMVRVQGSSQNWRNPAEEHAFDRMFRSAIDQAPNLLLCYGGHPTDLACFHRAKRAGVKIVFGLRNYGYPARGFFDFCDGVITSSKFLSDWYRTRFGVESTPLPLPIWPEDVIAENREPKCFTAINPTREKGLMILDKVIKFLAETRHDIPFLIVGDSPWRAPKFCNVSNAEWQANPKEIFAQTKVLMVPSVWEEPAGRVIAEAMLNGIPPIITDRGGMVEIANGGAYVLPLAKEITPNRSSPVPLSVAQDWIDLIVSIHDNKPNWAGDRASKWASDRARRAASIYLPEHTTPLYESYFQAIVAGKPTAEVAAKSVRFAER
jgi:glycosyltransferase involved in cell wall biosynthesis